MTDQERLPLNLIQRAFIQAGMVRRMREFDEVAEQVRAILERPTTGGAMSEQDRLADPWAEIERLRDLNREAMQALSDAIEAQRLEADRKAAWVREWTAALQEKADQVERLRGLLKRLEWEGSVYAYQAGGPVPICPACKQWRTLGQHADDCPLAAELA